MKSYSLECCKELKIDTVKLRHEIRSATNQLSCDMSLLTNYVGVEELFTKIALWRREELSHPNVEKSKISMYGELLVASLLTKDIYFEDWLASLAVKGYGNNTNRDIRYKWMNLDHHMWFSHFDVEIKTLSYHRTTVIIEHKSHDRLGRPIAFEYPDCLIAVRKLTSTMYQLHSMTKKSILERISIKKPISTGMLYEFNLQNLTRI